MVNRTKFIAVAAVAAIVGFLMQSNSPLGAMLWPPHEGESEPTGAVLGGLIAMGLVEAVAFGAGVAFLVFGWPRVRDTPGVPRGLAMAAFLAVGWGLVSWVPHTAMHISNAPEDFARLVAIEYIFHFTLVIGAAIVARFLWVVMSSRAPASARAPASDSPREVAITR